MSDGRRNAPNLSISFRLVCPLLLFTLGTFLELVGATIGESPFRECPNSFVGVQLWSIAGKVLDVQAGMLLQKVL